MKSNSFCSLILVIIISTCLIIAWISGSLSHGLIHFRNSFSAFTSTVSNHVSENEFSKSTFSQATLLNLTLKNPSHINESLKFAKNYLLSVVSKYIHLWQKKSIFIKIGVFRQEKRIDQSQFWIEFDPFNSFNISKSQVLFPFLIIPSFPMLLIDENGNSNFYENKRHGECSSTYQTVDNSASCSATTDYTKAYGDACLKIQGNTALHSVTDFLGRDITYRCSTYCGGLPPVKVAATTLELVFEVMKVDRIEYLDVDAQGADFGILISISKYLPRIRSIKMECQTSMYFYRSPILNDCGMAQHYLESFGFKYNRMELNNCGAAEFNLFMTNSAIVF